MASSAVQVNAVGAVEVMAEGAQYFIISSRLSAYQVVRETRRTFVTREIVRSEGKDGAVDYRLGLEFRVDKASYRVARTNHYMTAATREDAARVLDEAAGRERSAARIRQARAEQRRDELHGLSQRLFFGDAKKVTHRWLDDAHAPGRNGYVAQLTWSAQDYEGREQVITMTVGLTVRMGRGSIEAIRGTGAYVVATVLEDGSTRFHSGSNEYALSRAELAGTEPNAWMVLAALHRSAST